MTGEPLPDLPDLSEAPVAATGRRKRLIPLVVAFAFFLEQLDATIITTAIPDMAHSLDTSALRLNLALTAYLVTVAVFIPLSGWLADRFGMRTIFATAIAVFTTGSILCGFSWSLNTLVAARVLQGLGGAMMTPVGRLIMLRSFARSELVTAMSYMAIPSIIGPTIGPILGGFITTDIGWRWIFFVNIPFGIAGVIFALVNVREADLPKPGPFDIPGFLMCAAGAALLECGIEALGYEIVPLPVVLALFAGAVIALGGYALYGYGRVGAVLDLTLFRIRSFRVALLVGGISRISMSAVIFMLPLLLQLGFGYSPIRSGSLTFISSLGALLIRPISVVLLRRLGFDRLLSANSCIGALSIAGFALINVDTPVWLMFGYIFLFGVIRSVQFNSIQTLTYADVPRPALSRGTSLGGVLQQLAQGFGVSVSAMMLGMVSGEGTNVPVADFHLVFLLLAGLTLLGLPGFMMLSAQDGALVSNHRRMARRRA